MANYSRAGQRFRLMTAQAIDIGSINANSNLEVSITVNGARRDMCLFVFSPDLNTGVYIVGAKCATKGTVTFLVENSTGSAVDPTSHTYFIIGL